MATILITGGTGLIGKALSKALITNGHQVIILSRQQQKAGVNENPAYAHWDIGQQVIDHAAVAAPDHIIHLAGAGVADKRWTDKRKQEIVESRVKSSALL
ncbi:MAG: NAD-dependent epimerase/dehydratase family protein, partial [Chitinophagaceae bacterium]